MRYVILFFITIFLSGCSYFHGNRDDSYLQAKSITPLAIPPGLDSTSIKSNYPLPERNDLENVKKVDLTPPELNNPSQQIQS